jgi:hypothetical protein
VETGAANENVISEPVVGAAGLTVSEPEGGGAVEVLVDPVVGVELELEGSDPELLDPDLPEPEPPHPASTPTASSTAVPAAGTRIRTRRANSTIA